MIFTKDQHIVYTSRPPGESQPFNDVEYWVNLSSSAPYRRIEMARCNGIRCIKCAVSSNDIKTCPVCGVPISSKRRTYTCDCGSTILSCYGRLRGIAITPVTEDDTI